MKKINLEKVSIRDLENELYRRNEIQIEKNKKEEDKKKWEDFKNRPECAVTGFGHSDTEISKLDLATVYVEGNMGHEYHVQIEVADKVKTYFHNCWTHKMEREFQKKLNKLAEKEIMKTIKEPIVIIELMCLTDCYGNNKYYKEWKKGAMKTLKEKYTLKQLQGFLKEYKKGGWDWDSCHGQQQLVEDTIKSIKRKR